MIDHPLAQAVLTTLRDKNTDIAEFRRNLETAGRILGMEIVKNLDFEKVEVETPLGVKAEGIRISNMDKVVIISVLRAAVPLVHGLIDIFPRAREGFIGAKRIESEVGEKGKMEFPVRVSYVNIPQFSREGIVIVADTMFATGSTMVAVLNEVLKRGKPKKLIISTVVSTPLAIRKILRRYPNAEIYTLAIDAKLNERGYIVPGLGDAGDRAFG